MPYRLNKGVFDVRCRYPHCPFHDQLEIDQNIMGMTEGDVRSEALKMARDQAMVKHDSIYGRRHGLENPEIRMIGGSCQLVGTNNAAVTATPLGVIIRQYAKGEPIVRRGEEATSLCQVLKGYAYPPMNKGHRYGVGDCFGAAALLPNHSRLTDIVAGNDATEIAFYRLADLKEKEPAQASRLVTNVMEDTLRVMEDLGRAVDRLRKEVDARPARRSLRRVTGSR